MGGLPGKADGEEKGTRRGTYDVGLTWSTMSVMMTNRAIVRGERGDVDIRLEDIGFLIYMSLLEENFGRA